MIRTLAALATGMVVGASALALTPSHADKPDNPTPAWMSRTCVTEDSVNCYWPGGSVAPRKSASYRRTIDGQVCTIYVHAPRRDKCVSLKPAAFR